MYALAGKNARDIHGKIKDAARWGLLSFEIWRKRYLKNGGICPSSLARRVYFARSLVESRDHSQSIMLIYDASFLADNFSLLTLKGFKSPTELAWYLKLRKTFSRNEFVP